MEQKSLNDAEIQNALEKFRKTQEIRHKILEVTLNIEKKVSAVKYEKFKKELERFKK